MTESCSLLFSLACIVMRRHLGCDSVCDIMVYPRRKEFQVSERRGKPQWSRVLHLCNNLSVNYRQRKFALMLYAAERNHYLSCWSHRPGPYTPSPEYRHNENSTPSAGHLRVPTHCVRICRLVGVRYRVCRREFNHPVDDSARRRSRVARVPKPWHQTAPHFGCVKNLSP